MRRLTAVLLALLLVFALVRVTFAAPFSDLPRDHWAYDAVARLAAKGILEGYPDGLYRGDRAASRYEMAMAVARVVARLEELSNSLPDFSMFVTKDDLEIVKRLLYEFRDELDALGVRVSNLEEQVAKLQKRIERLEKVTFTGDYRIAYTNAFLKAEGNSAPGIAEIDPMLSWTSYKFYDLKAEYEPFTGDFFETYLYSPLFLGGYPIDTHESTLDLATVTVNAKVSGWNAKLRMRANVIGTPASADFFYGPQLSFYNNPDVDTLYANEHQNFYFDNVKLCNPERNMKIELGTFRPEYLGDYIFAGIPRSFYWRDEFGYWNPLWGWKITGGKSGSGVLGNVEYELFYGRVGNYNSFWLIGAEHQALFSTSVKFNFEKGHVLLSYAHLYDTATVAGIVNAQNQTTWGIELGYKFSKMDLGLRYAVSTYYYNRTLADNALIAHPFYAGYPGLTNKIDNNNSFFNLYLTGKFGAEEQGNWKLEYVSSDLFYEPFIVRASWGQLPTMNARWYLHNWEGFRFFVDYKFNPTFRGWLSYETYNQKRVWLAGDDKDNMQIWSVGFNYKFNEKFDGIVNYYYVNYKDKFAGNTTDNKYNYLDVAFRYFQNEKTTWVLGYTNANVDAPNAFAINSNNENDYHVYLGVNYQANDDTTFFATYRFLKFDDKTVNNFDASGNHLWMGLTFKFGQK